MLAVRSGQADIALNLIEHGAQANPQNNNGDTALLYAVSTDSPALVARLLDQGSDPYRRNELGESARALAEQNHPALLQLIKDKSGFHFPGF
jgi:ankyrin repeat protein